MVHAQSPALSGTVLTIAGNGTSSFSGDGGQATNAGFIPFGLAIGPDGTLYLADIANFRIRAVNPATGIITTVAGNGTVAQSTFGGQATNSGMGIVLGIAADRERNALYFSDIDFDWVGKVDLTNGLLTRYAGTGAFGFSGDGGPATAARLAQPDSIATDGFGKLFIAEVANIRVRQIAPLTGIITTLAGSGLSADSGDGGPATNASFEVPVLVAADSAGNVFVVDQGQNTRIRRIDVVTHVIATVAGGGTNAPGTGPATDMNLGDVRALVTDDAGTLFIANRYQVFQVDLTTGELSPFAGDGISGFSGDGGPALDAQFDGIDGLTLVPGGGLIISDRGNNRVRYVAPASITLTNDSGQTAFYLPWVGALSGDLTIVNNSNLTVVNMASLTSVSGGLSITNNAAAVVINMSSLTTVSGGLDISGNISAGYLDLGSLTNAGGVINMAANTAAGSLDLSSLISAGDITITSNTSATVINMSSLTTVSGSLDISGNISAGDLDLGSLTNAGGAINMAANTAAGSLDLGSLISAGEVTITGNTSATVINMSSLTTVSGDLDISGNTSANAIDMSSLTTVSGDLTIASNAPNANVNLNSLTNYGCGSNAVTMTLDGGTFAVTNGLTLCTNATLAGSSTVAGSITNHGTIKPGRSPGRLNITGRLVLGSSAALRHEIGGPAPNQFDFVNVAGPVTLGGTLAVSLINNFPSVMINGASFTVLTAGSPITGAFANVASGGTLTTTDGYARFTVLYAGETTVRLTGLVIVDTDSDGLPDWWEDQFSLSKTNAADAAPDLDGDGASNASEFRAGTQPNNAASVFRIVSVQRETNSVRLTWSTVGGKSYRVQTNSRVSDPFADLSPLITVPGTGEATTNIVDAGAATNAHARNYRVRLGP